MSGTRSGRAAVVGLAAVVTAAMALAGCSARAGGAADRPSEKDESTPAATSTAATSTVPSPSAVPAAPAGSAAGFVEASYAKTISAKTLKVRVVAADIGVQSGTTITSVDFATGNSTSFASQQTGGETESRLIDGVRYTKHARGVTGLSEGKSWEKRKQSADGTPQQRALESTLAGIRAMAPGVSKVVTMVGQDTVDGKRTTHYHVDVDLDDAARKADPDERMELELQIKGTESHFESVDVWIDDAGLLRKLMLQNQTNVLITFSDHGAPVSVTAPPAAEVGEVGK